MSEYKRNQQLLEQFKNQKNREKGEELLELLPQGPGSGLDADTVDKMHAEEIIEQALARIGMPSRRKGPTVGGGAGGMQKHGDEFHDVLYALADKTRPSPWVAETDVPVLTDAKYPNAFLLDGSRTVTGNVIKFTASLLKQYTTNWIMIRNLADSAYADFSCKTFYSNYWVCPGNPGYLRSWTPPRYVEFQNGQGVVMGGWGKAGAEFWIERAGDIEFLAGKTLKLGNISAAGNPTGQTRYIPVDDGGVTRYIRLWDSPS